MNNNAQRVEISTLGTDGNSVTATFIMDNPDDLIQSKIIKSQDFYEKPILDVMASIIQRDSLFIDVGGNIGNHSVYAGVVAGAKIISFEPNLDNFRRLQTNVDQSGIAEGAQLFRMAVGDKPGFVKSALGQGSKNTGGAHVVSSLETDPDAVPIVVLDEFLPAIMPVYTGDLVVKVDVEGMEAEVLRGMKSIIERYKPIIICEVSSDKSTVMVRNLLAPYGYIVIANFFKNPTLLIMPLDRAERSLKYIAAHSWDSARSYVSYCHLAAMKVRLQRSFKTVTDILGQ